MVNFNPASRTRFNPTAPGVSMGGADLTYRPRFDDPVFAPPGQSRPSPGATPRPSTGGGRGGGGGFQPPPPPTRDRGGFLAAGRATMPHMPAELLQIYADFWVKHGDADRAWAEMQDSSQYRQHFPHMWRPDGTMRFTTELEYMTWFEGQRRNFAEWGINGSLHEDVIVSWLEGDLSVAEANQRLGAFATGVMQQGDTIRGRFAEFYGPDSGLATADDRSLVSMALKPQLANDLFHGRITAAQISGEASARGFERGRERSEDLAFRGGLDQQSARQLFSQAQQAVPRFGRFAQRFNEQTGFGVEQFEEAAVFQDPEEQRRMQRLTASERALFSSQAGVRRDDFGAAGLRRR